MKKISKKKFFLWINTQELKGFQGEVFQNVPSDSRNFFEEYGTILVGDDDCGLFSDDTDGLFVFLSV